MKINESQLFFDVFENKKKKYELQINIMLII